MAIEKVLKIQNVGRFTALVPRGDVQFRRLTLIYGANGNGKTTLAGILRSLKTGLAEYIAERATLGQTDESTVELRVAGASATFKQRSWTRTEPHLEIFDTAFVSDNVYTGDRVDPEHRKNLYDVVIGATGVALAKRVDQIDAESRSVSGRVRDAEEKLRRHIQAPFPIDDFLALKLEKEIEKKIKRTTTQLNALRKSQEVLRRKELQAIAVPTVPSRVLDSLKPTTVRIAANVERLVREHIDQRLDVEGGEEWLAKGVAYLRDDHQCPFCTQATKGIDIVNAYSQFFSEAYQEHGVAIQQAINDIEQTFGEASLSRLQKKLLENDGTIQGWADLRDLGYAHLSSEDIDGKWRNLRDTVLAALARRLSNPAEGATSDRKLKAALRDYDEVVEMISKHNKIIERANAEIAESKADAGATKEEDLEGELRRLRNSQIRQQPEVQKLCADLVAAREEKKALDEEKKTKKAELEKLAKGVLTDYEAAINELLKKFGANFTITGTKPSFHGGKASSIYQISINNTAIELGDSGTRGTPCFRTALSAGDKSTLALAFFIARLHRDPDVGKKVVVLDDPLSSLDCFRVSHTQHEISTLVGKAAQVVLLSHDPFFLKRMFDSHEGATVKALHIVTAGKGSELQEWDVVRYCLAEAHQDYFVLRSFLEEGSSDLRSVARAIRPYLEGHLRHRFPEDLPPGKWLGEFIGKIGEAKSGPLVPLKSRLDDLTELNKYASPFHHSGSGGGAAVPNEQELRRYVERSIAFVQS
jgi:wobble nucleotide-excising tRNase